MSTQNIEICDESWSVELSSTKKIKKIFAGGANQGAFQSSKVYVGLMLYSRTPYERRILIARDRSQRTSARSVLLHECTHVVLLPLNMDSVVEECLVMRIERALLPMLANKTQRQAISWLRRLRVSKKIREALISGLAPCLPRIRGVARSLLAPERLTKRSKEHARQSKRREKLDSEAANGL